MRLLSGLQASKHIFVSFLVGREQLGMYGGGAVMERLRKTLLCLKQRNLRQSLRLANWSLLDWKTHIFFLLCFFPPLNLIMSFFHPGLRTHSSSSLLSTVMLFFFLLIYPYLSALRSKFQSFGLQILSLSAIVVCFFFLHLY